MDVLEWRLGELIIVTMRGRFIDSAHPAEARLGLYYVEQNDLRPAFPFLLLQNTHNFLKS
jgi:hypothetical protein